MPRMWKSWFLRSLSRLRSSPQPAKKVRLQSAQEYDQRARQKLSVSNKRRNQSAIARSCEHFSKWKCLASSTRNKQHHSDMSLSVPKLVLLEVESNTVPDLSPSSLHLTRASKELLSDKFLRFYRGVWSILKQDVHFPLKRASINLASILFQ